MIKISNIKSYKLNRVKFLKEALNKNIVLAGGALRHLFDKNEPLSDFDLFPIGYKTYEEKKAAIESLTILLESGFNAKKIFASKDGRVIGFQLKSGEKIQIIDWYKEEILIPNAEELLRTFDFRACMIAWNGKEVVVDKRAIRDIRKKNLNLECVTSPEASINRLFKFKEKGYEVKECIWQIVKAVANNPSLAKKRNSY